MKKLREQQRCLDCFTVVVNVNLDKVIPRQLFEVPIQAVVGKRVIARETLSALRADVTAGLYGGASFPRPEAHAIVMGIIGQDISSVR